MRSSSPLDARLRQTGTGKRLFIGLVLGTALLLCFVLALCWIVPAGIFVLFPWLSTLFGALAIGTMLAVLGLAGWLTVCTWCGQHGCLAPGARQLWNFVVRVLLPLMEAVGRLLRIPADRVRRSFIKVNNEIVLSSGLHCTAAETLVLLPHCIQASHCPHRLTHRLENCRRCGRCPISALIALRDDWGVRLAVAVGGSVARRIVAQVRPRLILAVACERDLAAGIQDTAPLPVFGILNRRPHGPCLDTEVDVDTVEAALRHFVGTPAGQPAAPGRHAATLFAAPLASQHTPKSR